jgi:hypothetical protein
LLRRCFKKFSNESYTFFALSAQQKKKIEHNKKSEFLKKIINQKFNLNFDKKIIIKNFIEEEAARQQQQPWKRRWWRWTSTASSNTEETARPSPGLGQQVEGEWTSAGHPAPPKSLLRRGRHR